MSSRQSEDGDHARVVEVAAQPALVAMPPKEVAVVVVDDNQELAVVVEGNPPDDRAVGNFRGEGSGLFALRHDDRGVLLVVATLITTLSYQIGSSVPGGYWQDDAPGHHRAGEPIMRTQRRGMYRLFIWGSWIGFASSIGLAVALLTGMPPRSRFVRGLFVLAYSTLILTFVAQQWHTVAWVSAILWVAVIALIAAFVTNRTHRRLRWFVNWLCRDPDN
uniref:PGG domain-containing protein n=1 Tax=Leersia perrieri TaxID=77586 RepID=A0A0D9WYN3_9ORYZ